MPKMSLQLNWIIIQVPGLGTPSPGCFCMAPLCLPNPAHRPGPLVLGPLVQYPHWYYRSMSPQSITVPVSRRIFWFHMYLHRGQPVSWVGTPVIHCNLASGLFGPICICSQALAAWEPLAGPWPWFITTHIRDCWWTPLQSPALHMVSPWETAPLERVHFRSLNSVVLSALYGLTVSLERVKREKRQHLSSLRLLHRS